MVRTMPNRREALIGMAAAVGAAGLPSPARAAVADQMVYGTFYGFVDLNPFNLISHSVCYLLFDALTYVKPRDVGATPRLAESWKRVEPNVIEFRLRQGVRFSDWTPLTADDVKFSFDTVLGEKLPVSALVSTIDRVEVVDPLTVRIATRDPDPILEKRVALVFIVPRAAYAAAGGTKGFGARPVGSGQYVMTKYVPGSSVEAEAAPAPWRGKPATRRVVWQVFTEPSAFLSATQAGQLDVAQQLPFIALRGVPGYKVEAVPVGSATLLQFDTTRKPFDDVRVRQAFNHAINTDAVIRAILYGGAVRLSGQLPGTDCVGHDPSLSDYPYDPARARALLKEAGLESGFETEIVGRVQERAVLDAVSGELGKVGVRAKVTLVDYGAWSLAFVKRVKYPILITGLSYTPLFDAAQCYQWVTAGSPETKTWNDARWDELFAQSKVELDPAKRCEILVPMARYLHDQAPFVFLYRQRWPIAYRETVHDLDLSAGQYIDPGTASRTV